ncbi:MULTISPECIES: family 1 encapsulin nanocompartment shell protein [Aminobacterium]|uniref:family 1 encapsulin nanocompartment shell protein n=1 Tax=Aminobacterium TaxID=81466 RepID=UPI0004634276|nr:MULTISPECIES: family 1 encapsulin nanocompartment shell protein [Aminobacterium]
MDILRRSTEMVSAEAWHEMDEQAKRILETRLSARKFVDITGPKGWDYAAHSCGRLEIQKEQPPKGVMYGIHEVLPLIEARAVFDLDLWELDNITRGLKNPDLTPLEEATKHIADFEEKTIYTGLPSAKIEGLLQAGHGRSLAIKTPSATGILETVSQGLYRFQEDGVSGPYALVASPVFWQKLHSATECYPLAKNLKDLLGGPVILSSHDKGSFLVSIRGGDMELIVGQDFSLGYIGNEGQKGTFFLTESFTFRVINPEAIILLTTS